MNDSRPRNNVLVQTHPIFLGGLDRTGKTLMRLMLTSHSNIAITRRTYMWSKFSNNFGDLKQEMNFNRCLNAMLRSKSIQYLDPEEGAIRHEFSQGEATYPRLFEIIQRQFAHRMGKNRWGDQMGMIEHYADPIFSAYPSAKIIHMIRDPRERYVEKFATKKTKPGKFGWETERWLKSIRIGDRNLQRYPRDYKIIRFELFISNPEKTIREVCEFIGEHFEQGMLTTENAIRFGNKPVDLEDYLVEIQSSSSPHHNDNEMILSNREVVYVQSSAKSEMLKHGYALAEVEFSLMDWINFIFIDWPINYAGGLAWKYSASNTRNALAFP